MTIGFPPFSKYPRRFATRIVIGILGAMFLAPVTTAASPGEAIDLAVIEPVELARDRDLWTVLDARPKSEWQAQHIPGALSFSWQDYTGTDEKGIPYRVWQPQDLANALGKMGIDENAPLVVYADADKSWGGEGWACWMLAWLGHKGPVRLLSGGIQSWYDHQHPVIAGAEDQTKAPRVYHLSPRPELDIQAAELEAKGGTLVLVDTRSTLEWWKGHLPGAIHIPWTAFHVGKNKHPVSPDDLKRLLKDHGVDMMKPVVYYCTGGVRSGYAWTVHQLSGLPTARNYEGGVEDWIRRSVR